jgi:hypothetical protein
MAADATYTAFLQRFPQLRTLQNATEVNTTDGSNVTVVRATYPDRVPLSERGVAAAAAGTLLINAVTTAFALCTIANAEIDR